MSDDDPFENFDADADREGDPFEHLTPSSDDIPKAGEEPDLPDPDAPEGDDPAEQPDGVADEVPERKASAHEAFPDASENADEDFIDDIDGMEADPFETPGSAFEHVDVGEVDADEVWERLQDAQERGSVGEADERTERVVSKREFCQGCEYFSDPPEIDCSHDGTDIVEFPDVEHVLVLDCPIVAEREELENLYE
ncbi:hypothetical protein VB779_07990 [Haloarculaceae archaeon H-GB11]|nr:hypothetical protein [Haloarculaceae archaeon H-GB11]